MLGPAVGMSAQPIAGSAPEYEILSPRLSWRILDIAERLTAGTALALATPILIPAATAVWFLSGRSPFVAHLRKGQDGLPFWMLKLRTMWTGRERTAFSLVEYISDEEGPRSKAPGDRRIHSAFARLCPALLD